MFGRSFWLTLLFGIVMFSVCLGGVRVAESKKMSKQYEMSAKQIEQIEDKLGWIQLQFNMYAEK